MKVEETPIEGLKIIKPTIFEDERGHFFEPYNNNTFKEHGITVNFVQDNQSLSQANVLRGLHFQKPPHDQGKLVRVVKGRVLDVAVDIRSNSNTYGKYVAIELSESNKISFFIPSGFAHGFLTLEDNTIFEYKCTNFYNKNSEGTILWNDPQLTIDWKIANPLLSDKDKLGESFENFISPF